MRTTTLVALAVLATGCRKQVPPEEVAVQPPQIIEPMEMDEEALDKDAASSLQLRTVYFDFDQALIREDARAALLADSQALENRPGARIRIEGHCDERGTTDYNLALGQRRAEAIKRFLLGQGIEPNRMTTQSYGEEMPAVSGRDETAYAQNRRGELEVVSDDVFVSEAEEKGF